MQIFKALLFVAVAASAAPASPNVNIERSPLLDYKRCSYNWIKRDDGSVVRDIEPYRKRALPSIVTKMYAPMMT